MGIEVVGTIPNRHEIKELIPLDLKSKEFVDNTRTTIINILKGIDKRILLFVGPCSLDGTDLDYKNVEFIMKLREKYKDKIEIIFRAYSEKPRSDGTGFKGILKSKPEDDIQDIAQGIIRVRELFTNLAKKQVPIIYESLYSDLTHHFEDCLASAVIGARSSEDNPHTEILSGLDCPVGIKNSTSGDIRNLVNSIHGVQHKQHLNLWNELVNTPGNPNTFGVLRGGHTTGPNYNSFFANLFMEMAKEKGIINNGLVIDCSHDNSRSHRDEKKDPQKQICITKEIFSEVMPELEKKGHSNVIKGLMIESNIGKSYTDACLGEKETEDLVEWVNNKC